MSDLLIGNTGVLDVIGLRDAVSGAYYNSATVTATIKTLSGTLIATITLAYVAASNGDYRGTIPSATALVNETSYVVEVSGDAGVELESLWRNTMRARYRTFNE